MIEFIVEDMVSDLCAGTIADAIKNTDQDAVVEVNVADHLVRVDTAMAAEDIEAAISGAGYSPALVEVQSGW